jgi:hypothetical protein
VARAPQCADWAGGVVQAPRVARAPQIGLAVWCRRRGWRGRRSVPLGLCQPIRAELRARLPESARRRAAGGPVGAVTRLRLRCLSMCLATAWLLVDVCVFRNVSVYVYFFRYSEARASETRSLPACICVYWATRAHGHADASMRGRTAPCHVPLWLAWRVAGVWACACFVLDVWSVLDVCVAGLRPCVRDCRVVASLPRAIAHGSHADAREWLAGAGLGVVLAAVRLAMLARRLQHVTKA